MERLIKFRGKDLSTDEWVYGFFAVLPNKLLIGIPCEHKENEMSWHTVDANTIGQFTGLHDMDGKDIYEGDILRMKKEDCLVVVGFNDAKGLFGIRFSFEYRIGEKPLGWWLTNYDFELVGNRFDNPSLLKGGYV